MKPSIIKFCNVVGVNLGLLCIMGALVMPLLHVSFFVMRILYCIGTAIYLLSRLVLAGTYAGLSLRERRLHRLELWSAIFFTVGAAMMFIRIVGYNDAVAFTLAGGALVVYTSIMLPRAAKKQ